MRTVSSSMTVCCAAHHYTKHRIQNLSCLFISLPILSNSFKSIPFFSQTSTENIYVNCCPSLSSSTSQKEATLGCLTDWTVEADSGEQHPYLQHLQFRISDAKTVRIFHLSHTSKCTVTQSKCNVLQYVIYS